MLTLNTLADKPTSLCQGVFIGESMNNKQVTPPTATPGEPEPIQNGCLIASVFPSLVFASVLVPMEYGQFEYARSYLFLFAVAVVTGIVGVKRKMSRYVTAATALLWAAPFLPIIVTVIVEAFSG